MLAFYLLLRYNIRHAGVAEWQTRLTQNQVGNRGGSSPFTGTKAHNPCF